MKTPRKRTAKRAVRPAPLRAEVLDALVKLYCFHAKLLKATPSESREAADILVRVHST